MQSRLNFPLNIGPLEKTMQNKLAIFLIFFLGLTRFNHFGSAIALPDASWAVFFLAGFWIQAKGLFPILILESVIVDYFAIQHGVSGWCVSSAYAFLVPSYAALWFSGFYFRKRNQEMQWKTIGYFFIWVWLGVTTAFFISNESFYRLSGKFSQLNWFEFYRQVFVYYKAYLITTYLYVTILMGLVVVLRSSLNKQELIP